MSSGRASVPAELPPYYSLAIAAAVILLDYLVGPRIEFPGMFLIPVAYGAWYGGRAWGLPLSLLPLAHVGTVIASGAPLGLYEVVITAVIRILVLAPTALWIATVGASQRALSKEVALLEGLLPICSYCKKIRDDAGQWQRLEKYIQERSTATFTHGVCETCLSEQLASAPMPRRRSG
ncbi:MAG: hypothetical protein M3R55_06280 [Acidobacteriota bacterium]|nr:hypothetical protein [Acidobacteriota bacterium]